MATEEANVPLKFLLAQVSFMDRLICILYVGSVASGRYIES